MHLYQCVKTRNPFDLDRILKAETPALAKRIGGEVQCREDWTEQVKKDVMLKIQEAKYTQQPDLGKMLLATNDEEIIEGKIG